MTPRPLPITPPPLLSLLRRLCLGAVAAGLLLLHPLVAAASLLHLAGPEPSNLGVREGHLAACASPAHCSRAEWLFGFVDDLELHAEAERGVLEARSVSRLGDSDLGVNARRLETLRRALEAPSP